MSSSSPDPRPSPRRDGRGGPLSALLRWVGRAPPPERPGDRAADLGDDASQAAIDLVDQAEAFQSLSVADVMTPRADVMAVELSAPFAAVVAAFAESEHSRLPVYRETLDDPVGVVHLKDVFKRLAAARPEGPGTAVLAEIKRDALYVPPSMRAADLLVRMQASRIHMAMVIDEFGGMDGVVTLEDVIEAVVGEIDDEHDEAAVIQIVARAGGVLEIDGRLPLEELEKAAGRTLTTPDMDDEDIDTAAGLVSALAGRVPQRGEVIAHPEGLEFEVTDADPRRVKRLRLRPASPRKGGVSGDGSGDGPTT